MGVALARCTNGWLNFSDKLLTGTICNLQTEKSEKPGKHKKPTI
jgi:hypothetical protein